MKCALPTEAIESNSKHTIKLFNKNVMGQTFNSVVSSKSFLGRTGYGKLASKLTLDFLCRNTQGCDVTVQALIIPTLIGDQRN